jgi:hypothetical protein
MKSEVVIENMQIRFDGFIDCTLLFFFFWGGYVLSYRIIHII